MGVIDCDNMLMLLGVSTKMTEKERDVVMPLLMRGFKVITLPTVQATSGYKHSLSIFRTVQWRLALMLLVGSLS